MNSLFTINQFDQTFTYIRKLSTKSLTLNIYMNLKKTFYIKIFVDFKYEYTEKKPSFREKRERQNHTLKYLLNTLIYTHRAQYISRVYSSTELSTNPRVNLVTCTRYTQYTQHKYKYS